MVHQKCRGENYSTTEVKRFQFPDDLIYYEVDYPEYQPTDFTGKCQLKHESLDLNLLQTK